MKYNNDILNKIAELGSASNSIGLDNIMQGYIDMMKKGSKIYIKPENRGKFTKSAKAAGKSVQEHARSVVNNPKATTLQKRRAQFAINAKKWNHKK